MAARNVVRLWKEGLVGGDKLDLENGQFMKMIPAINNYGALELGNGTLDMDFKVFMGADGSYVWFDSSGKAVTFSGVSLVAEATTISGALTLSGATALTGVITPSASGYMEQKIVDVSANAVTINATHYGAMVKLQNAGVTTVTLPAPAAGNSGAWLEIFSDVAQNQVLGGTAGKLAVTGNLAADTYTLTGAIGACLKVVSDGALWHVTSEIGTWAAA